MSSLGLLARELLCFGLIFVGLGVFGLLGSADLASFYSGATAGLGLGALAVSVLWTERVKKAAPVLRADPDLGGASPEGNDGETGAA